MRTPKLVSLYSSFSEDGKLGRMSSFVDELTNITHHGATLRIQGCCTLAQRVASLYGILLTHTFLSMFSPVQMRLEAWALYFPCQQGKSNRGSFSRSNGRDCWFLCFFQLNTR